MSGCCGRCCRRICTTTVRQHLTAAGVGHGALAIGILLAWSSTAIPELQAGSETLGKVSTNEASWISNITLLGALLAVFPTGYLADRFGKTIMLISGIPILIGWIIMGLSHSVGLLLFGRFIAGFSGGALSVIVPLYVTEIAETKIRGMIGYSFTQQFFTGALFVTMVPPLMHWDWRALGFNAIPISIILFVAAYFLPDSPRYLFRIGENGKGSDALKWFRTTSTKESIDTEIKDLESYAERMNHHDPDHDGSKSFLWKQIWIPAILMLLQQLSCGGQFILGMTSISHAIKDTTMSPTVLPIIIVHVSVLTVMMASNLVDRIGRRPLLIFSCLLMSLAMVAVGLCLYIQTGESEGVSGKLKWIRLISFSVYICAYSFGLGPISWLLMAELVPDRRKGIWTSVVTMFFWLPAFIIGIFFSDFVNFLTLAGVVWFCATVCISAALFSYLFVPETANKSLSDIQAHFQGSKDSLLMDIMTRI